MKRLYIFLIVCLLLVSGCTSKTNKTIKTNEKTIEDKAYKEVTLIKVEDDEIINGYLVLEKLDSNNQEIILENSLKANSDKFTYELGDKVEISFTNLSENIITYGHEYEAYYFIDGSWYNESLEFDDVGFYINSGVEKTKEATLLSKEFFEDARLAYPSEVLIDYPFSFYKADVKDVEVLKYIEIENK